MIFDGKDYRCVVSSGVCSDTSQSARLSITNNVGLAELNASKLQVYPNPSQGLVYLEFTDDLINETYYLANFQGQVLRKGVFKTNSISLDLGDLPAGT